MRIGLGERADEATLARVRVMDRRLEEAAIPGVIERVPAYTSVTVYYKSAEIGHDELCAKIADVAAGSPDELPSMPARVVTIPVVYGGESGPDLEEVARLTGLTVEQVVELHSGAEYRVVMMGFAPGFPYLSGLPERLATPRLAKPRLSVPAGSVGIGGSQTGVYPIQTPGGWRIIGRTSAKLFDPARDDPFLLRPGDIVRFTGIGIRDSGLEAKGAK